jgi:hypothetical protein
MTPPFRRRLFRNLFALLSRQRLRPRLTALRAPQLAQRNGGGVAGVRWFGRRVPGADIDDEFGELIYVPWALA